MKARRIAVLALIALVLPLGVARAATNGCNPGVDLFGCIVSGSGSVGLQVENSGVDGTALAGQSVSGTGVSGSSLNATGVYGQNIGTDGGAGVVGFSATGWAMVADGPASQTLQDGGWVKALVRMAGSRLSRCYNSQASSTSDADTCNGFSITGGSGNYTITFPFRVNDRYVVITTESVASNPRCCMIQYDFPANSQVRVRTWDQNGAAIDRAFSLVVF